jgi:hypothetical protein
LEEDIQINMVYRSGMIKSSYNICWGHPDKEKKYHLHEKIRVLNVASWGKQGQNSKL